MKKALKIGSLTSAAFGFGFIMVGFFLPGLSAQEGRMAALFIALAAALAIAHQGRNIRNLFA